MRERRATSWLLDWHRGVVLVVEWIVALVVDRVGSGNKVPTGARDSLMFRGLQSRLACGYCFLVDHVSFSLRMRLRRGLYIQGL